MMKDVHVDMLKFHFWEICSWLCTIHDELDEDDENNSQARVWSIRLCFLSFCMCLWNSLLIGACLCHARVPIGYHQRLIKRCVLQLSALPTFQMRWWFDSGLWELFQMHFIFTSFPSMPWTMLHMHFFIFFSSYKNHNKLNNAPKNMRIFALHSIFSLVFFDIFFINCARLEIILC